MKHNSFVSSHWAERWKCELFGFIESEFWHLRFVSLWKTLDTKQSKWVNNHSTNKKRKKKQKKQCLLPAKGDSNSPTKNTQFENNGNDSNNSNKDNDGKQQENKDNKQQNQMTMNDKNKDLMTINSNSKGISHTLKQEPTMTTIATVNKIHRKKEI